MRLGLARPSPYHARFFAGDAMQAVITRGQRYVCDSDPELGLGLVTDHDQRTLTLHFPASDTTRCFAQANAPLTRIRFEPGDSIEDLQGQRHVVSAVHEHAGLLLYDIGDPSLLCEDQLSPRLSLAEPLKRLLAGQIEADNWFKLRRLALATLEQVESSPLLGLCSGRTALLPHQLYIAHEVARRPAPRVLLSDEVGLGKTIEACLILQQQLFLGLASRVLIVVPESLLHQWLVELLRRFNLRFSILDAERCEAQTAVSEQNPFETEQLVLCSRDFLAGATRWLDCALAAPWDLLILDETHHLLAGSKHPAQARDSGLYRLAESLARHVPGVLLLTATPDQEGLSSHFALLHLLDPARFHDYAGFMQEQQQYQALATLLDPLLHFDTLEASERKALVAGLQGFAADPELQALTAQLEQVPAGSSAALCERLLQALLDRHGTGRIVFRNTRRHVSGFPPRRLQLQFLPAPERYRDSLQQLYPELAHLQQPEWLREDPRVAWIAALLRADTTRKFLLICHARATAEALERHLNLGLGIRSAVFHEGMTLVERDRAAAWFADREHGAQVLVCSEIGSEGRNFQFASDLLLFDLPDHPDLLEQRIGRLDRIGQQHEVCIHLACFRNSAQHVLLQLYDDAFDIFRAPNPVAAHVCEALQQELAQALTAPDDPLHCAALVTQAQQRSRQELAQHAAGRDRLLELNSCRPHDAAALQQRLLETEQQDSPATLLQAVFAAFGLDFDINGNGTWNVRPGDDMLLSHFPQVPDDGLTFTLQRDLALVRDDLPFVNWLHPLVQQSLDLVLQEHQGKACVALLRDKRLPAGSLVLEALYRVTVSAAPQLQARRWFPVTTLRTVVDSQKRSLGKSLDSKHIDARSEVLERSQARLLLAERRSHIEQMQRWCGQLAQSQLPALVEARTRHMQAELDSELARLRALREVNPQVEQREIDYLLRQRETLGACFAAARLQLAGLRLLVVV